MLYAIARLAIAAPRRVIAVAVLVMVGTAFFGIPVITSLSAGGMGDPTSESALAARLLTDKFDQADMEMLITVTSDGGAQSPRATAVGTDLVQRLQNSPNVGRVPTFCPQLPTKWVILCERQSCVFPSRAVLGLLNWRWKVAVAEGFEPPDGFSRLSLSRRVH